MYLAVSNHAVSAMLLRIWDGAQWPVYYISKILVDVEIWYLPLEKLAQALVYATRKFPYYFQAHTVYVLTKHPLQPLLRRSDFMGLIAKWGTRLGSFDVRYKLRNAIKGQVLADFVVEFTPTMNSVARVSSVSLRLWQVYMDGGI